MPSEKTPNNLPISVKMDQGSSDHNLDIFSRHSDLFKLFTLGRFEVRPPQADMKTFYVDLSPLAKGEKAIIYGSPAFYEKTGRSDEKAINSFLHELNHIQEIIELFQEDGGTTLWRQEQNRRDNSRWLKMLDNIQDDIRMDRGILQKSPSQAEIQEKVYYEDLYRNSDYLKLPKHIQFMYALFRESMLPNEECVVSSEVREHLNKLKQLKGKTGKKFWDFNTSPAIPPSVRIDLRRRFLEPIVKELFDQDVEDKKNDQSQQQSGEGKQDQTESDGQQDGESSEIKQGTAGKPQEGQTGDEEPKNPEDYFSDYYDEFDQQHQDPAFSPDDLRKAIEHAADLIDEENKKTPEQKMLEAYAKSEGVTVAELLAYQKFYKSLEEIKNPETDETVIEELRKIFRKIIAERSEPKEVLHYPREEGQLLYDPAGAVTASKAGQPDPAVWMEYKREQERQEKYGGFDIILIGDRSGSMEGNKANEQKKAMMLLVEALREFSEELEEEQRNLLDDLEVRTEVRTFGDTAQNELLKLLDSELTEKQRVLCFNKLADVSGGQTQDYVVLKELFDSISEEDWDRIKEKKLCKIVIVLTDGDSSNSTALQSEIQKLRKKGVVVVGIGITSAGISVETNYSPDGRVCADASALAVVLSELLQEFLKEL